MTKLVVASIKMLYRDKQTMIYAIVFPLMFAVVFGLFDFGRGPNVRVAIVAPPRSAIGDAFTTQLRQLKSFTVKPAAGADAARRDLERGVYDLVVIVPVSEPRPNETATVTVAFDQGNADRNAEALQAVRQVGDALNLRMAGVTRPAIAVVPQPTSTKNVQYYDFLLPGLVAMGVMNFAIIGLAVSIARFREQRILKRILATPLRPVKFLAAQVIARVLLSVLQAGVIMLVGVTMFDAHIFGNVVWMFVLSALASLIFLNIAFAIAGRAPNADAAQGLGQVIAIPMMFLSGVFFPTDTLPKVLQKVVAYLPLTPVIKALRAVSINGASITATGSQLLQLGIWVVVSFVIASRMFRFSEA